jgi:Protein of unknown function (DUF1566)
MRNLPRALWLITLVGALASPLPARAHAPAGRYVVGSDAFINGPGGVATVTDTKTKLTWQRDFSGPMAYEDNPLGACESLNLDTGAIGWRLPTLRELLTIVDYAGDYGPNALIDDRFFPGTPTAGFVSSTSTPQRLRECVDFTQGWIGCGDMNYWRCVR